MTTRQARRASCRALALAAVLPCLVRCSTTHVLHLSDPAAPRQIEETYLRPGTVLELTPVSGAAPPALKYDVAAPATGGLLVSDGSGVPTFARFDQIRRLETIDRAHGAREGAMAVGVPALLIGFGLGFLSTSASTDGGSASMPVDRTGTYAVAAGLTITGMLVGALYGAVAGHRDIYIIQP